jgi:hypothetical protein
MADIKESGDALKASQVWYKENKALVDEWYPDEK